MERSADFLVKVIKGFTSYSVSSSPREYQVVERPDEDLYDLNVILKACKNHLEGQVLDEDERSMVGVVLQAVEQMLAQEQPNAAKRVENSD